MTDFLRLLPPDEARARLLSNLVSTIVKSELVATPNAVCRVTAEDIAAPHALPEFSRSSMDGYAIRAADSFGASESLPAYFNVVGEVKMSSAPGFELHEGQASLIHTGGMLPDGANAVVMQENTQAVTPATDLHLPIGMEKRPTSTSQAGIGPFPIEIEVMKAVAPGENVIAAGEDVLAGQVVLCKGIRLRPVEIGGLMALGISQVRVAQKPRVGLVASGDEVIDPNRKPNPGQVRDVNTYTLASLISQVGGESTLYGIIPDDLTVLSEVAKSALASNDVLILTGGSSMGTRDMTAKVISSMGSPGVLVHGINIRPGKPTILGICDGKPVIGLPGNPVSAMVIAYLFVVPVIETLLGLAVNASHPAISARLTINLASQTGREDWCPVVLEPPEGKEQIWRAVPIFSKSNLIFSLVRAQGLVRIPLESNGFSAGETVEVHPL